MILTAFRAHWLNLKRDRLALLLTFVVPVIFFSIFAAIFSSMNSGGGGAKTKTIILDLAQNEFSKKIEKSLCEDKKTFVFPKFVGEKPLTEEDVERLVSDDKIALGIVFPEGMKFSFDGQSPKVRIYADTRKNPIAYQMINGILQKVAMTNAPEMMFDEGMSMMEKFGGEFTDQQKKMIENFTEILKTDSSSGEAAQTRDLKNGAQSQSNSSPEDDFEFGGLIGTDIKDVRDEADKRRGKQSRALVSSYASGIAVMFLLFSMTGAAGGILEEKETGTLDRVLDSKLGLNGFLLSYWLFTSALGFVQVFVMFLWGWFQFNLDLFTPIHLTGFVVVTLATSGAAAAFGLMLGALCQSRAQLNGVATTVVLIMSALGGSMIPRFVLKMNDTMEMVGNFTFNAWALDAYENVFWRDKTVFESGLQICVLAIMTVVFLGFAWTFAQRWKRI